MSDINKELWHTCKLCNKSIKDLAKIYGGCGVYYTKVFTKHLEEDHNVDIEEYFTSIIGIEKPKCLCGCGKDTRINKKGSKFYWIEYACGRYPGTMKWSEEAKVSRKGSGNPMYEKESWNKGLTKYTSTSLLRVSLKSKRKVFSKETKLKMSVSAKKRSFHGHTGRKHSGATKRFLRTNTLRLIKEGVFGQTNSKPHKIIAKTLQTLGVEYIEEKQLAFWSFDFYLPLYDIYIEVDGDYFHSNPKFYPDGPKTKTQKNNYTRQKQKDTYCKNRSIKLLRLWEDDILNNLENTKCNLKKLLKLDQ